MLRYGSKMDEAKRAGRNLLAALPFPKLMYAEIETNSTEVEEG